jgi:type I restriction enzyme S subunit
MHNKADNWPERPLGELLDIARQTMTPGAYPAEQFVHYSIPAWDETRGPDLEIGASIGSAKICIKQPTILVSKLNPRIPRVVLVESPIGQRHCASTEFIPYVAKADCVSLRFYKWFLQSPMFQRRLEHIATGSTNSHTRAHPAETLKWNVPSPAPEEQRRIAAVLDTVDEAIAKTEAVIAKLKQVRAGLLHDLLTHGLDRHGQLRDPITHPEQFYDSPLGRIPREWAVLTIEALLARVPNALRSGPFGSALLKQELKESGIPLLGIDNVHIERFVANYMRFVDDDKFVELRQYTVRAGDVMITIMGTVGRCCVVPDSIGIALSSKHVWTITLDRSRYSPHVACWQMNFAPWVLRQFKRDEQGGVMTAIRSETLRQLLLPVPSPPEMQAIEEMLLQFNRRIGEEETLLSKLTALKSGLMTDLLTGRVRVPEEIAVAP